MAPIRVRGFAGSVLLVAGGYCYVRVPRQTWVERVRPLHELRHLPGHVGLGLTLGFAGLVLLTWAWCDLVRAATDTAGGVRTVRATAALWSAPLLLAPPLFSGDGWSYVATGYLTGHGLSPYLWTPAVLPTPLGSGVSPHWLFTPSPYGPLPLVWGGLFSDLTADPWVLLAAYRLLALIGLALVAWAVPPLARRAGVDPARASALAVASPFVLAHGVGGLHNDLLMSGLMLAALAVTTKGRWVLGAVLVGTAAAVKVPGAAAAVGVVLLSLGPVAGLGLRVRRTTAVAGVVVGTVLVAGWASGLGTGWVAALSVPDRGRTHLALTAVLGGRVRRQLLELGPPGHHVIALVHPEILAKGLGVAVICALATWVLLRRRLGDDATALGGAAAVLVAATVLSPVVHYWYALWCVPLLPCLRLSRAARAAVVAAIAALGLTAIADPALRIRWLDTSAQVLLVMAPVAAWGAVRFGRRVRSKQRM